MINDQQSFERKNDLVQMYMSRGKYFTHIQDIIKLTIIPICLYHVYTKWYFHNLPHSSDVFICLVAQLPNKSNITILYMYICTCR